MELHVPLHNFMGPGTHIIHRITNGILPINQADAASMIHDIEYLWVPQDLADQTALANARGSIFDLVMNVGFYIKEEFLGQIGKRSKTWYDYCRRTVTLSHTYQEFYRKNYPQMKWSDGAFVATKRD